MFEDITEDQFNQREADKNAYKHILLMQIEEQQMKKH
jgi:hypothetical protein